VDLFGRYVPRAVVNQLIQRSELEALTLGGVKRDVTVLFADIRGFTTFSQDLSPEDVVSQLNALLEILVACTFEHGGTLDKFIGDAILVLFNAPLDQPDHVERAARTALSMQKRLNGHVTGLCVGIGVHRGEAVVGNIGTPQRMEYTAIGSTVNIASRLCDAAQPGQVVISQTVLKALPADFVTETLGAIQVKGIKQPLEVARLLDGAPADA
jgi:adenylate cyclase